MKLVMAELVMMKISFKQNGFTLVEMAVVLVIIGLVLSAAISMGNTLVNQSRISVTKTKLEAIKTALVSYIARNNRLPCPAIPTTPPSTAGYGIEAATPGTCVGISDNVPTGATRVVMGILPWITLGLSDESGQDGYYNRFSYAVTANATNLNKDTIAGMLGNISIHDSSPITLGLPPIGNQINSNIVTVIISHGANANGAYSKAGNQVVLPMGSDERENTDLAPINSAFIQKEFAQGANPFDDIVLALNPSEFLTPLTINGSIKDYNATLQHNFDLIVAAATSYAVINRTGTTPNFIYKLPLNIAAMNLPTANTIDPWGTPIFYDVSVPNIDKSSPDSLAITLISNGPDGNFKTSDDISTTVRVVEFKSKFTNYGW